MNSYTTYREKQKQFLTSEGHIAYIDEGKGPVLLLLHGIPTSGWLYRKMITPLVSAGYRVIVPDMLGFGSSASPKGYEIYAKENQVQRLIALMDYLKIDNWIHVFHDAAGIWTWELCKQYSNRIKSLVILNTIIYEEGFKPPIRFRDNILTKFIISLYTNRLSNRFLLNALFRKGVKTKLSEVALEGYRKPLLEGKNKAMYYFFSRTHKKLPNHKEIVSKLAIPVLVIWGKGDEFLKWHPQAKNVIEDLKIPLKNIHELEANHFIQEEQPDTICTLIQQFLIKD